jgi:hypothetical protein
LEQKLADQHEKKMQASERRDAAETARAAAQSEVSKLLRSEAKAQAAYSGAQNHSSKANAAFKLQKQQLKSKARQQQKSSTMIQKLQDQQSSLQEAACTVSAQVDRALQERCAPGQVHMVAKHSMSSVQPRNGFLVESKLLRPH